MSQQIESCHKKLNYMHIATDLALQIYYYVQWTGHFVCKKDFYIKRRGIPNYLLIYTISGSATLVYENRKYTVRGGDVMFIDCTRPHEYYPDMDGWEFKYVHFNGDKASNFYSYVCELSNGACVHGRIDLERHFDRILENVNDPKGEEICSEHIYRILISLIRLYRKDTKDKSINFSDVFTYIEDNHDKDLSVSSLAKHFHMSRCYFSSEFKRNTGFTPYEYILNYRIQVAKRMLYGTSESVENIAMQCGFSDTSSFIRAFKRLEGKSPAVFRKMI